ncbi:MAG: hypothetical protein A3J62_03305 [Candidatus Buchananbacteria bacterium RIFCSPHIGHO2_02_FULL_38_8]|uniref:Peptidase S11 D-alanyl-D-alanine carboxypeptidase A N-terminal domain-containing protein n=1 Tax=Candidatus Buchananbacteria bacterium RIFCSPHIGHO2_02_FULL_38_8 TaxID=1797538 RepID=A0A1G1Y6Y8_9BACT|nr:MAG: hypothetical protein A3J62_03305 [Candidatus Buchananbacteria bacterium RIFCSPHIGHO2_02_FULL_38_8]
MFDFLISLILASLLIPQGFNFLLEKPAGYFYPKVELLGNPGPTRIINNSLGVETTAKSVLAIDETSGTILFSKNHNQILPIASITKLMTVLVFLDNNPGWDKTVTISQEDQRAGGIVYLLPGEQVSVKDLFYLTMVASSNEAAIALTRSTGLEDFTAAMNSKAAALGMSETYFLDPSGLNPANTASPLDLVKLAKVAFAQTEILSALKTETYEFTVLNNQRRGKATNTDKLLDSFLNGTSYQVAGAKTGYLDEAGYNLLVRITKPGGPGVILVLLGSVSQIDRWQEAKGIIDWIFRNYQWVSS